MAEPPFPKLDVVGLSDDHKSVVRRLEECGFPHFLILGCLGRDIILHTTAHTVPIRTSKVVPVNTAWVYVYPKSWHIPAIEKSGLELRVSAIKWGAVVPAGYEGPTGDIPAL